MKRNVRSLLKMLLYDSPIIFEINDENVGIGLKTALNYYEEQEEPRNLELLPKEALVVYLLLRPAIRELLEEEV